jgi:hypothetical protein
MAASPRYAYHFFFNRMIPLAFIEPTCGEEFHLAPLKLNSLRIIFAGEVRRIGYHSGKAFPARDAIRFSETVPHHVAIMKLVSP